MSAQYNVAPGYVQVPAPTLAPPRVGLLASAEIITDSTLRWEGGYFYLPPLATGWSSNFPLEFCESSWGALSTCEPTTVQPFLAVQAEKTSTFNKSSKDLYSRTREALLANEPWVVDFMFVNGGGINMPYLMNPSNTFTAASTGFVHPIDALAAIDYYSNGNYTGERWMIHVDSRTLNHLLRHQVVRREGNIYRSPYDNIVVPSLLSALPTPPSETAPSSSQAYMYATTMVQIRRSELIVLPEPVAPTDGNPYGYPTSAIDRSTNLITVSTQRIYGISFTAYGDGSGDEVPVLYAGVDFTLT